MKKINLVLCLIFLASLFILSCQKQPIVVTQDQGQLSFDFNISNLKNKLVGDTAKSSTLASVIVSVEDLSGKVIKNSEKVELYNMDGNYISKPLSLPNGTYKLTRFLVLDWQNNVVYASPLKGSAKAYLISNPLPLTFSVQTNTVSKVSPEVLNAASSKPEDFGYATFSFNVAQTFDFLVGTFIYSDTIKNYKLTSSLISIYSDSVAMFLGSLVVTSSGALVNVYDSLGVTNRITLPERYNKYSIVISKPGYKIFKQTYTKEELKLHLRSIDKGPLVVILERLPLEYGLVAYYKFNNDIIDYSGNSNNGAYYGRGVYATGYKSDIKSAIDLNGSTDYVVVKNSATLNPNQISVCAWYYAISFYGNGSNSLITKSKSVDASSVSYQYHLNVLSDSYGGDPNNVHMRQFGFNITTDQGAFPVTTTGTGDFSYKYYQYQLSQWNFVVGVFDGVSVKLYVNGDLKAWRSANGNLIQTANDVYIGGFQYFSRPIYDFTGGRIDEVRIYNRALTEAEIVNLYQQ